MGLVQPEDWKSARQLSAELFKRAVPAVQDRREVANFLEEIPIAVESILASLNSIKASCTVVGIDMVSRQPTMEDTGYFRILSPRSPLRLWLNCDRDMDCLLCELAFGGTGVETGEDELSRPVSKIELRLRRKVFEATVEAIAIELHDILELDFAVAPHNQDSAEWLEPEQMFEVKLLVNAFSYGCEFTMQFLAGDFDALFQQDVKRGCSAYEALQKCVFEVEALLPPEQHSLDAILSLQPGGLLALGLSPSSSVVLNCGGIAIFTGEFRPAGNRAEIVLMPTTEESAIFADTTGGE